MKGIYFEIKVNGVIFLTVNLFAIASYIGLLFHMANPMINFSPGGAEDDFDDDDDDGFVLGCDNHLNNNDTYQWSQQNNAVIIIFE